MIEHMPRNGLALIVAGGATYTAGAIVYLRKKPDPFPTWMGSHGLWHLLVLAASALFFAFMALHAPRT